jgi:hypothetical protein
MPGTRNDGIPAPRAGTPADPSEAFHARLLDLQRWNRAPDGWLLPWICVWQFWHERLMMRALCVPPCKAAAAV